MGNDHVAERARLLEEPGAALDRQLLGNVDLHVVDVPAVADRLEQPVREAERENVLHGLRAEEMIDPKDLRLRENGLKRFVQRAEARSRPKGFSTITRARSLSPDEPSIVTIGPTVSGGTAR